MANFTQMINSQFIRRELLLVSIAFVFLAANYIGLLVVAERPWYDIAPLFVWLACAVFGWWILQWWLPYHDPYLYTCAMLLSGWGIVLIDRLLPNFAQRQITWMILGVIVLSLICLLPSDLRWLRRYRYTWLLGGLALLAFTIILGVNPSGVGPRLWLGVDEYFFQPSEFLKVFLVVFLASYMADHQEVYHDQYMMGSLPSWRFLTPIFVMWSLCMVLLIWQRDLGAAAIFFLVFLLMLYVASGQALLLMGGVMLLLLGGIVGYFTFDVVALRVNIWLDPWQDADNTSFQIVQSLLAIAEGGILGRGIGQGIPTFIPVVHTDFTYAAIAEEWGSIGALGVLSVLLIIVSRGLKIAMALKHRPFHAYVALGVSVVLAVQTLMIVGGTLGFIPLTGVTLPFVSYGGSSLVTNFVIIALLLKLSSLEAD